MITTTKIKRLIKMSNILIERALYQLDKLCGINEAYDEAGLPDQKEPERANWMPSVLHDFMFHLSGPSDPYGHDNKMLNEVTVFDRTKMPKTSKIMDVAQSDSTFSGGGNLHKKIREGFRKADEEMSSEDASTRRKKHRESRAIFNEFAQQRGFKTGPKMLRGNMKTEKSSGEGVATTGLNLAPHSTSGLNNFDTCPNASSECRKNCLGTEAGGNRQYPDTALSSKVLRTHFIAKHPEHAARLIDYEIENHKKKSKKEGKIPGVRLNITSDFAWEHYAPKMFERHKDVQFYDYTKSPNRVMRQYEPRDRGSHFNRVGHPSNYHLTLSHTGADHPESNDAHVSRVLENGGVVASVFQKGKVKPTHFEDVKTGKRYPIVNGDDDDNTFDRHSTSGKTEGKKGHGVVSGLQLKGVKNEDAGKFANKVDPDGIVRFNRG
jgi:hypothetical protein